jgi:ABC-2 type transport system permease protein
MEKIKTTNVKRQAWLSLGVFVLMIILVNFISSLAFFRIDFTKEKRFTLSDASKSYMKNLNDIVYVTVYLEGEFPAGFKRLRNATKETLDDLKALRNLSELGVEGAIVGKALYAGAFTLEDALEVSQS